MVLKLDMIVVIMYNKGDFEVNIFLYFIEIYILKS